VRPATNLSSRPEAASFAAEAERPASRTTTSGSLALAPKPSPEPEDRPHLVPAKSPEPSLDLDALQSTLVAALASTKGQQSASDIIHDASLTLVGDTLHIQTTLSKTILPVAVNADADRILKSTLRDAAPSLKLTLLPGTSTSAAPKKKRAAPAGSAADLAENHPLVQRAKHLFSAEISNVVDLRDKD
jgi:DNA polymerase-3 subunit gamma/tau